MLQRLEDATSQVYFMFIGILNIQAPNIVLKNLYVAPESLFWCKMIHKIITQMGLWLFILLVRVVWVPLEMQKGV